LDLRNGESNTRIENWLGYDIRFVEKYPGEWWAVAADISKALGYRDAHNMFRNLDPEEQTTHKLSTSKFTRRMVIVSETGIYEAVFNSNRTEAKDFKRWVKQLIRELRQSTGLEGFQVFRMLTKNKTHPIRTQ